MLKELKSYKSLICHSSELQTDVSARVGEIATENLMVSSSLIGKRMNCEVSIKLAILLTLSCCRVVSGRFYDKLNSNSGRREEQIRKVKGTRTRGEKEEIEIPKSKNIFAFDARLSPVISVEHAKEGREERRKLWEFHVKKSRSFSCFGGFSQGISCLSFSRLHACWTRGLQLKRSESQFNFNKISLPTNFQLSTFVSQLNLASKNEKNINVGISVRIIGSCQINVELHFAFLSLSPLPTVPIQSHRDEGNRMQRILSSASTSDVSSTAAALLFLPSSLLSSFRRIQ